MMTVAVARFWARRRHCRKPYSGVSEKRHARPACVRPLADNAGADWHRCHHLASLPSGGRRNYLVPRGDSGRLSPAKEAEVRMLGQVLGLILLNNPRYHQGRLPVTRHKRVSRCDETSGRLLLLFLLLSARGEPSGKRETSFRGTPRQSGDLAAPPGGRGFSQTLCLVEPDSLARLLARGSLGTMMRACTLWQRVPSWAILATLAWLFVVPSW